MGRPGITQEQVFEAATAIAHEGITPTVMAVRKRLGGGSPNNITKWLTEWKEQNEAMRIDSLPPLPEQVEAAMRRVWGIAWKDAQDQLESERETLSAARKEIERERAEMLAEISRLDGELEETRMEIQERDKATGEERRSHDETRAELRETKVLVNERSRRIDEQAAEIHEARLRSSEAQSHSKRLESDIAHLDRELAGAKQRLEQEIKARSTVADELERTRAENQRLSAEVRRAEETAKQAKAALDLGGKKVAKLEGVLEEERQAHALAEREAAELRVQVATLTERTARVEELHAMIEKFK